MVSIHIDDALYQTVFSQEEMDVYTAAAQSALNLAGFSTPADLSIVMTGDDHLQKLNREFLGIDAPTDVLSFPADEIDPDTGVRYLGDILLSYPRARAQAEAGKHPIRDEIQLLIVHGVLHLLGYDHVENADRARMWAIQADILSKLGCSITTPPS